jgi:hypothetical protein
MTPCVAAVRDRLKGAAQLATALLSSCLMVKLPLCRVDRRAL